MPRWPWISREHHEEVLSAKNELILALTAQNAALTQRLAEPVAVTVKLPDDFVLQQAAIVRKRRPVAAEPQPAKIARDWASINEDDPKQIAQIAAEETGGTSNAYVLSQTVNRIRKHVQTAKLLKARRALTEGRVGTIQGQQDEHEAYVPSGIRELIESAEKG